MSRLVCRCRLPHLELSLRASRTNHVTARRPLLPESRGAPATDNRDYRRVRKFPRVVSPGVVSPGGVALQDRRRHQARSCGPRTGFAEMLSPGQCDTADDAAGLSGARLPSPAELFRAGRCRGAAGGTPRRPRHPSLSSRRHVAAEPVWSQVLFGEFGKLVGNGTGNPQRHRRISDSMKLYQVLRRDEH
jgi:hypothetical protein